jgi:hypothetical protein
MAGQRQPSDEQQHLWTAGRHVGWGGQAAHRFAVGRGALTQAEDLLDAAIERVEARNPAVNAVSMPLYDYGRKTIADGPFRGVPFLLKDLGGWPRGC